MAFLIKFINLGKERLGIPKQEHSEFTSFGDKL